MSGANISLDTATFDDDHADLDVGIDLGAITDDERIVPADFAAEAAVDPHPPLEVELALKVGATPEERGDLGRGKRCGHGKAS